LKSEAWNDLGMTLSKLGFGCAPVMGRVGKRQSLDAMAMAYDNGVTHFDVARSYGYGEAEKVLGIFASGRRDKLTIATKFGIVPPNRSKVLSLVKPVARIILERLPFLRSAVAETTAEFLPAGFYSVGDARNSIEKSLLELQTDYIDILFIHDCRLEDELSDELLVFLDSLIQEGKIRAWGLATGRQWAPSLFAKLSHKPQVAQYENNIWTSSEDNENEGLQTHSIFHSPFGGMKKHSAIHQLCMNEALLSWASREGIQIDHENFRRFMLEAAIDLAGGGIVICSMFNHKHIKENIAAMDNPLLNKEQIHNFIRCCKWIDL